MHSCSSGIICAGRCRAGEVKADGKTKSYTPRSKERCEDCIGSVLKLWIVFKRVADCVLELQIAPGRVVPWCWRLPWLHPEHCEDTWTASFYPKNNWISILSLPVKKSPDPSPEQGKSALLPEPRFRLSSRSENDQKAIEGGEKWVLAWGQTSFPKKKMKESWWWFYQLVVHTDSRCI